MKLILQIPCHNEANTLPQTLDGLPASIPGISCIETLVIDDGSDDGTADVAQQLGVNHVLRLERNRGLAYAFQAGMDHALRMGADIIVNTDGDNQYPADQIPLLVSPILEQGADLVIGDRQVDQLPHFSALKRLLQRFGSRVVRAISETDVPDTVSGFRAYSREAALRLNVLSKYSYTLETIIQAGKIGLKIVSVPVRTNPPTRPSRLQRNMWHFIKSQASTILRVYAYYEPLRTFTYVALPFLMCGGLLLLRFLIFYLIDSRGGARFLQSVTIGTGLLLIGFLIFIFGIQADISGKHRRLTEETLYRLRKMELNRPEDEKRPPSL